MIITNDKYDAMKASCLEVLKKLYQCTSASDKAIETPKTSLLFAGVIPMAVKTAHLITHPP